MFIHTPETYHTHWMRSLLSSSQFIDEYQFRKLEPPFDTNCYDYSQHISQSICLNDCYINRYQTRLGCLPRQGVRLKY